MTKFLKRTFLFLMVVVTLLAIKKAVTPYYLGNSAYKLKLDYSKRSKQTYNTVVFGSSRVFRQVNSMLLDSLLSDYQIKTFNFGSAASYNPESFYLFENYIEDLQNKDVKYAFLELQNLNEISNHNLKSTRASYWNTIYYLQFAYRYIFHSHFTLKVKYKFIIKYTLSYIYSFIDMQIVKNVRKPISELDKRKIGLNGFYNMEQELLESKKSGYLKKSRDVLLADTMVLHNKMAGALKAKKLSATTPANQYFLDFLLSMIHKAKQKDIDIILVLPPLLQQDQYMELIPVASALPEKNIIRLEDPEKYREFYLTKCAFDVGHLNALGARLFTNYLAQEFIKKHS